jgi:predicted dehydrogenase
MKTSPDETLPRRDFLKGAVAAAATMTIVPRRVLGQGHQPPSEMITRVVIGTGSMGMNHVTEYPETVAVCDVDAKHLARALEKAGQKCEGYSDWRRVLDREDVDVIHIGTPPHWHALISIAACQAGFDVYCEKPMTRFIREGRVVADTVSRYGRVFTINCYPRDNRLRKIVQSGLLGRPLTFRLSRRNDYNWKVAQWSGRRDLEPLRPPPELDYDMWLGPAPAKPYHWHRVHGSFRGYWDYDGGGLSDMGQHYLEPIHYALDKGRTGPVEVEAYAPWPPHPEAVGMWGRVTMRYEDGTVLILESGEWGEPEPGEHAFIEGPNGKYYRDGRTDPPGLLDRLGAFPDPPEFVWFDTAVRTRQTPSARPDAEAAHRSVTLVHLANIAIRTGRKIRWDPVAERVIGDEEANRLVDVPMRAPWHL